jgi:hypothetical protein
LRAVSVATCRSSVALDATVANEPHQRHDVVRIKIRDPDNPFSKGVMVGHDPQWWLENLVEREDRLRALSEASKKCSRLCEPRLPERAHYCAGLRLCTRT